MRCACSSPSTMATSALKMLDTKSVAVTWCSAIVSMVCCRSRNSPAAGSTVRPPVVSGHSSCHSEESKVCLLFCSTTSSPAGAEPAGHEPQPVGQPAVPVQRALGGAGRPRGEEAVAQVGRAQRDRRAAAATRRSASAATGMARAPELAPAPRRGPRTGSAGATARAAWCPAARPASPDPSGRTRRRASSSPGRRPAVPGCCRAGSPPGRPWPRRGPGRGGREAVGELVELLVASASRPP